MPNKLPNPDFKRRFTLEAEAILGSNIDQALASVEKSKLVPKNVIREEEGGSSGMSSSNLTSNRTNRVSDRSGKPEEACKPDLKAFN